MFCEVLTCVNTVVLFPVQRHFHPVVRRLAAHLIAGAPVEGSEALKPELSRRWYQHRFIIKLYIADASSLLGQVCSMT